MIGKLFSRGQSRPGRISARSSAPRLRFEDPLRDEAFSPTRPQFSARSLAGRQKELARIMRAISQEHAHVVLFGDRGRGKSSLANAVAEQLQRMNCLVARASCDAQTDFDTLIRNLMRSLPASLAASIPPDPSEGCESLLSRNPLSPRDVAELPGLFGGRHLTLMVEEFDRIADPATRSRISDAIKQLSDRGALVAFMLVGVADDAGELIGDNPSVHRSVVPVELALLPEDAVRAITEAGFRVRGVSAQPAAIALLVELARGTPYIAHLLGLRAAQIVSDAEQDTVTTLDVIMAARQVIQENNSSIKLLFAKVPDTEGENTLGRVIAQIASGKRDDYGRFRADPAASGNVQVAGKVINEAAWSQLLATGLVRRTGQPSSRVFSFASSHLEHYVMMMAVIQQAWRPLAGPDADLGNADPNPPRQHVDA